MIIIIIIIITIIIIMIIIITIGPLSRDIRERNIDLLIIRRIKAPVPLWFRSVDFQKCNSTYSAHGNIQ